MDPFGLFVMLTVGVLAAPVVVYNRFLAPAVKVRRILAQARPTPIRDLTKGTFKLSGQILLDGELISPLTGRPCAAYECVAYVRKRQGWLLLAHEVAVRDFLLDDGTGVASVVAARARLALQCDRTWETTDLEHTVDGSGPWVRARAQRTVDFGETVRFDEGILEQGERVAISGQTEPEADPSPGAAGGSYREAPSRWLIRAGHGGLLISDDPEAL